MDLPFAEKRIQTEVEDGSHAYDGEGVEVADDIVGDALGGKHCAQRAGRVTETLIVDALDGEE